MFVECPQKSHSTFEWLNQEITFFKKPLVVVRPRNRTKWQMKLSTWFDMRKRNMRGTTKNSFQTTDELWVTPKVNHFVSLRANLKSNQTTERLLFVAYLSSRKLNSIMTTSLYCVHLFSFLSLFSIFSFFFSPLLNYEQTNCKKVGLNAVRAYDDICSFAQRVKYINELKTTTHLENVSFSSVFKLILCVPFCVILWCILIEFQLCSLLLLLFCIGIAAFW